MEAVDINIVNELPNKYREISFERFDIAEKPLDNDKVRQFCDNFRLKVSDFLEKSGHNPQIQYSLKENQSRDINSWDLLNTADSLGIPIVIWQTANLGEMGSEGGHWRLLLEKPGSSESVVQTWDPLNKGLIENMVTREEVGNHMYTSLLAEGLAEKYSLKISQRDEESMFLEAAWQGDDYNCGSMVFLNAMLRANALGYVTDENRAKISDFFGVDIPIVPPLNTVN